MAMYKQTFTRTFDGNLYTIKRSFRKKSDAVAYAKKQRSIVKQQYSTYARVVKSGQFWLVYVGAGKRVRGIDIPSKAKQKR